MDTPTPPILDSPNVTRTGVLIVAAGVLIGNIATIFVLFLIGVISF